MNCCYPYLRTYPYRAHWVNAANNLLYDQDSHQFYNPKNGLYAYYNTTSNQWMMSNDGKNWRQYKADAFYCEGMVIADVCSGSVGH